MGMAGDGDFRGIWSMSGAAARTGDLEKKRG